MRSAYLTASSLATLEARRGKLIELGDGALWCVCEKKRPFAQMSGERVLICFDPGVPPNLLRHENQGYIANRTTEWRRKWEATTGASGTQRLIAAFENGTFRPLFDAGWVVLFVTGEDPADQKFNLAYSGLNCREVKTLSDPDGEFLTLLGLDQSARWQLGNTLYHPRLLVTLDRGTLTNIWAEFNPETQLDELISSIPDT